RSRPCRRALRRAPPRPRPRPARAPRGSRAHRRGSRPPRPARGARRTPTPRGRRGCRLRRRRGHSTGRSGGGGRSRPPGRCRIRCGGQGSRRLGGRAPGAAARSGRVAPALLRRVRMATYGYKLMSEEHGPSELVRNACRAEEVGFDFVAISDHYHPWLESQGHSPHASTLAVLSGGRFTLGLGAGENLNEHVVGLGWPPPRTRQEMLREAIDVIRLLGEGREVSYEGAFVTLERAQLW